MSKPSDGICLYPRNFVARLSLPGSRLQCLSLSLSPDDLKGPHSSQLAQKHKMKRFLYNLPLVLTTGWLFAMGKPQNPSLSPQFSSRSPLLPVFRCHFQPCGGGADLGVLPYVPI